MDNRKRNKDYKYFFVSMFISAMVIMLIIGFVITEHNIHHMFFGDKEPFFEYSMSGQRFVKLIFFGKSIKLDFDFLFSFIKKLNLCEIFEIFKHKIV